MTQKILKTQPIDILFQATDSLMDKLKLKPVNPHRLKNNNTAAISAN